jgi:hypothetical protein
LLEKGISGRGKAAQQAAFYSYSGRSKYFSWILKAMLFLENLVGVRRRVQASLRILEGIGVP